MNGKKAKKCRKLAYGDELSPRHVLYKRKLSGMIIADYNRQLYQSLKKKLRGNK